MPISLMASALHDVPRCTAWIVFSRSLEAPGRQITAVVIDSFSLPSCLQPNSNHNIITQSQLSPEAASFIHYHASEQLQDKHSTDTDTFPAGAGGGGGGGGVGVGEACP